MKSIPEIKTNNSLEQNIKLVHLLFFGRFWTHMYGSGIGDLNVYVRVGDEDTKIWGLSGDAGNNWYMAQAPVSSTSDFRIVFEGVVGRNSLGNIAVDDVSIMPGVCPSKGPLRGRKKIAGDPSLQLIFFFPL